LPVANLNQENVDTWVYPASKSFRTYQFKIVRTSLFQNTLVTLPTGLGKTFIASTVMFNFYRWFTDGMIFFVAPTKPLVNQQIESFSQVISEVPLDTIAELTGTLSKQKRQKLYQLKRVFFMTPQTL
jgi:ERCC4-related helicase